MFLKSLILKYILSSRFHLIIEFCEKDVNSDGKNAIKLGKKKYQSRIQNGKNRSVVALFLAGTGKMENEIFTLQSI